MDKKKIIMDGTVLAVPLLGAFSWFAYLVLSTRPEEYAGSLSPGSLNSLVTFLFIFIVVYGIFLIYKFRHMKKQIKK